MMSVEPRFSPDHQSLQFYKDSRMIAEVKMSSSDVASGDLHKYIRIDVSGEPAYLDKELFREKFSVSIASTSKITELFTSLFSAEATPTVPVTITVDRIAPILGDYQEKKAALLSHRFSLYSLPKGFQSDKEIVLAAVKQDGWALAYASEELRGNKDVIRIAAVGIGGHRWISSEDVFWQTVLGNELDCFNEDRAVVLAVVTQNGRALEYASEALKRDLRFLLEALQANKAAINAITRGQLSLFTPETLIHYVNEFPLGVLRAMGSLNLSEEDRYKLFNRFLDDTVRSAISEMTSDDASRFEAKLTDVMLKYKNLEIVRFLFRVIFDLKQKDKLRECITNIGSFSGASLHPATFLPILALHSLPISAEKLSDFATRIRAKHGVWKHDLKLQALLQLIMSLDQAQERLPTSQIEAIIDHCLIGDLKKEGLKRVKLITAIAAIKPDALESIEAYESRALLDIVIVDLKKEGLIDEGIEDLSGKFAETFLASPVPEAILTYSALHYHDPSMKEAIRIFIGQVLEGTFIGFRNAHNSHAGVLSVDQKSIWESASTREVRITKEGAINLQAYLMTKLVIDKHGGEILRSEVLTEALEDLTLAEQAVSKLYKELGLSDEERLKLLDELEKELPGSCEFKNDVIALKRVLTDKSAIQGRIKDTDDPQDLFLSGTLVQGSCQRIDGDPGLNKCLMGYCLDGKIRMLALKDLNGKLKARAIVKLLIDHRKRPALYLERVYPADDPAIRKAFQEVLKEKAKAMGSKLYEGRGGEVLTSHGNRAPYEYEDGGVGISNGTYSIYAEEVAVK